MSNNQDQHQRYGGHHGSDGHAAPSRPHHDRHSISSTPLSAPRPPPASAAAGFHHHHSGLFGPPQHLNHHQQQEVPYTSTHHLHTAALTSGLAGLRQHQQYLARYPEVGLFNQLGSLFPMMSSTGKGGTTSQPPSTPPASASREPSDDLDGHGGRLHRSSSAPLGASASPRASSKQQSSVATYAVRHQAAEQRRRARINDRLDHLRTIVPHPERSNTAGFLDLTINYVIDLQDRVKDLEARVAEQERGGSDTKKRSSGEKDKGTSLSDEGRETKKSAR